ncbi:IS607 family element RNA-guided endonuclease TnpB [Actinomadura montaniterrae]|uniref:IS200/IS605 family element transposase accessory protein TnpB n=1 Tax=Actinomadura montaniterrae TaxID=1803903 RepID=A0A6L3VS28_9ACTN|nr:IS607 family element RNA-guided endonuclease TnpB [Actinomadura montaniterrae]KAB2379773.1 IS200/IS605 family element transposase accessory protein TnpB [Actinomadura montaniterrae]
MLVTQAYRFALDPSPRQERGLWSHAGAARFAWNWGLAACRDRYDAEGKWWSGVELHRLWNRVKKTDPGLGWWGEHSKCVHQEAFRDLDRALRGFVRARKGLRKGRRPGFPRFKKRGRCRDSFRFGSGVMRCSGRTVTLPRLGTIATHESTRKLARRLENGTARILSATVSRTAHRWFVSFTVQVDRNVLGRHARPGTIVGVDLGVTTLLTGVDDHGAEIEVGGPKALRAGLRKLQRLGKAHARAQRGSANRAKAAKRLARHHARVAAVRADALHKATSTLAARYETVVVEDLNVTGMLANRRLAGAVADQGFGAVRRMLDYKTGWNGGRLVVADRWFPSSKTCSGCGGRKPSLSLSERTFRCDACGLVLGRDVNAAINLRNLAASGAERRNACGGDVRPGPAGRPPAKQEPGTAHHAGETGTAAAQATAIWTADAHIRSWFR